MELTLTGDYTFTRLVRRTDTCNSWPRRIFLSRKLWHSMFPGRLQRRMSALLRKAILRLGGISQEVLSVGITASQPMNVALAYAPLKTRFSRPQRLYAAILDLKTAMSQ